MDEGPNQGSRPQRMRFRVIRPPHWITAALSFLAGGLLSTFSELIASPTPARPNILLIVSDDQA